MFAIILLAFVFDLLLGEPQKLPHPVAIMGKGIDVMDRTYNQGAYRKEKGILTIIFLVALAAILGILIQKLLISLPLGFLWVALVMSIFIASRSLYEHVLAVKLALSKSLAEGRLAIAKICGRDPDQLGISGVARGAIESLAESFCDGIIAPLFWGCIFGLPGMLIYKMVNTADSMIGHKNARYLDFGWAAARLDDLLNWIPARLSALILIIAGSPMKQWPSHWQQTKQEAAKHESPNAGWPEAAMALLLKLSLGGPRIYDGMETADHWLNEAGRKDASPSDISEALRLFRQAWVATACLLGMMAFIWH